MHVRPRLIALLAALALTSCGDSPPTPESDAGKRPADIEAQAAALDVEALEQTIASYAAKIATLESRIAELQNQIRNLDAGQLLGAEGSTLSKEAEMGSRELVTLNRSRRAYEAALAAKRG